MNNGGETHYVTSTNTLLPQSAQVSVRQAGKPKIEDIKTDEVLLTWNSPEDTCVTHYEIKFKSVSDTLWKKATFTDDETTSHCIRPLSPQTEYQFKVRAHYLEEEGEFSDVSDPIKTLSQPVQEHQFEARSVLPLGQPGKPSVLDTGIKHISIAWDKPEDRDVEYYEIKLKLAAAENWLKIPQFTEDSKPYMSIGDLAPATEYEFKVRGHDQDDEGTFSEKSDPIMTSLSLNTKSTPPPTIASPRKPGTPTALEVGEDYVHLRWNKPDDRNVEYYEIKSKQVQDSTWKKNPMLTEDNKTFCRVSDLQPASTYEFKVRAHYANEEGDYSDTSKCIETKSTMNTSEKITSKKKGTMFNEIRFRSTDDTYTIYVQKNNNKYKSIDPPCNDVYDALLPSCQQFVDKNDSLQQCDIYNRLTSGEKRGARTIPSKPNYSKVGSDYIYLIWNKPEVEGVIYYEVKYRLKKESLWKKTSEQTDDDTTELRIYGLLQQTEYVFKVRALYKDTESEFSEESDVIQTRQSSAEVLRFASLLLQDGTPSFYKLPMHEHRSSRNEEFKTRKLEFGSSNLLQEKTIMMIGATGSGKSTLIDAMVNYLVGVKWEDNFRFKTIDITTEEEERRGIETESQTDWITSYRVHPQNSNSVKFILNIIDTPGFGDTRGIERDKTLVDQIRAFFTTDGPKGIETVDVVCFVIQAPNIRMTVSQRYIFDAILSIFGKDIADNIVAMVTFADGKEPPVLNALAQANVPYAKHFVFNNSALFEPNTKEECGRFGKMFWEMGSASCDEFFTHLPQVKTQSLQLTTTVLETRDQLNTTIAGLIPQIDIGLGDLATIREESDLVTKFEREIRENKNFTYMTVENHQITVPLKPGEYVTNCMFCHVTCHFPCHVRDDEKKRKCSAMKHGVCTVCPKNCPWNLHKNTNYRIEIYKVKVQKTYEEMKVKYELAEVEKISKQSLLKKIKMKFISIKKNICEKLTLVRECGNYLRENALKVNPLTEVEYIDFMIQTAKEEKKPGFIEKVKMLKILKKHAEITSNAMRIEDSDELLTEIGLYDDITSVSTNDISIDEIEAGLLCVNTTDDM